MIFSRLFSILLRVLQLATAVVVTGIVSDYIDDINKANGNPADRMVYTLVIAVFSIIMAFLLLIPFTATLTLFPLDFLFFILWIVSFGLLVGMFFNSPPPKKKLKSPSHHSSFPFPAFTKHLFY